MRDLIDIVETGGVLPRLGARRREHVAKHYAERRPESDPRFWKGMSEQRLAKLVGDDPLTNYPMAVKAGRDSKAIRMAPIKQIRTFWISGDAEYRSGQVWHRIQQHGLTHLYDGEVLFLHANFAFGRESSPRRPRAITDRN